MGERGLAARGRLYLEELGKSVLARGGNGRSCNFWLGVIVEWARTGGAAGRAPTPPGLHRCRSRGCGRRPAGAIKG